MFSICLPSPPQCCSLSSHHSSPLTGVTIPRFSKPFSQSIVSFTPPPPSRQLYLISLLALLSFHPPPPLSPTHPPIQFFIPLSFSSPCFHVSNLTLPDALSPSASADLCLPSMSAALQPLSLPLLPLCFLSIPLPRFSSFPCIYHLFPLLDSPPSPSCFPSSVYSQPLCFSPAVCSHFSLKQ